MTDPDVPEVPDDAQEAPIAAEAPDGLGNLAEQARANPRLTPAEEDRALALLKETLLEGKSGISPAVDALVAFPWQVGVRAVVEVWPDLKPIARTQLLSAISKQESDQGRRFRMSLSRGMFPIEPAVTAKLTPAVCKQIWKSEGVGLSSNDRQMLWNVFIGKGKPWLLHLAITDWKPADAEILVHCAIAAVFNGRPSPLTQESILRWAAKAGRLENLTETEITLISEAVRHWPGKLRGELLSNKAALPAPLLDAIEKPLPGSEQQAREGVPAPDAEPGAPVPVDSEEPDEASELMEPRAAARGEGRRDDRERGQDQRRGGRPDRSPEAVGGDDSRLDVTRTLRQLDAYFNKLRNELSQAKARLQRSEQDSRKGGRRRGREVAFPEEETEPEDSNELSRHNAQLEETVAELRRQLEDLAGHHEDMAESMGAHLEAPATDAQEQFKKLLAIKLKKEFSDFRSLEKEPPDEVLREHYRLILEDVFGILQAQGVPFGTD